MSTEAMKPTAGVRISAVSIRRFRCLASIDFDLSPTTTYLVGENNSGKTAILSAISAALTRQRPTDDDLYRGQGDAPTEDAEVDLVIVPSDGLAFGQHERGALGGNVHRSGDGHEYAGIRCTFSRSREGGQLLADRAFLQPGRAGDLVPSPTPFLASALALFDCEFLDASRDLLVDLGSRTSKWGRVLFDLQIPEQLDDHGEPGLLSRSVLEDGLKSLADDMLRASPVLRQLEQDLKRLSLVQPVGDVSLRPFPPKLEEVMRSVDVLLAQSGGPSLPLRFQGMGSRSLAALFVFATLCKVRLGADKGLRPHLLTLVEEPEAHLHPHAITALRLELDDLPGQRIVSTHSTHLVCESPLENLRVLRRRSGAISVHLLTDRTIEEASRFRRFVERPFGELFFARAVVFGDGAAERDTLPILLAPCFGVTPAALGVSIVDCESMNHPQVPKLITAASELGLPWVLFVDNDAAGSTALSAIIDPDTGLSVQRGSNRVVIAGAKAIEQLLLDAGYRNEIDQVARDHGESLSDDSDRLRYLTRNKAWANAESAKLAMRNGRPVPKSVVDLASSLFASLGMSSLPTVVATP